jgi:drug/metabolite transporter (DMT)-like permease
MKNRPLLYTVFAISLITLSQAAPLVRLAAAPPEVLGFWRIVFALVVTFIIVKIRKENIWSEYVRTHFKQILWAGLLFFLHFWVWFYAVQNTTIANSTLLFCLNPLFVTFFGVLQKQKLTWPLILALVTGIVGIAVMEWGALSLNPERVLGDVLAIVAAFFFASYIVATKKLRVVGSNYVLVFWFNVVCVVGFGIACIVGRHEMLHYPEVSWMSFLGLAIGPSLLGHAFFSYSLKFLDAAVASCFVLLEPVLAAVTASWFFGESLSHKTIIGFIVISAGLLNLFLHEAGRQNP